jgi:Tfp pilus assembly protein PilV
LRPPALALLKHHRYATTRQAMSRTCTRRALRDERGSFLLEVLISAFLLVLLTGGAIAAFDTAAHQSGHQRAQAVASNLAATEMERLRTVKFSDLDGLDVTHPPKQVDGTSYTIRSQTAEAFDPQAAGAGCDTSSRSAQALRATTTVSWGGMGARQPVRVTSIIAAPASANSSRGNYTVQVLDKDGLGVNGLTIQLQGPSSVSGATDENGCVRFTDLIPDNGYHLLFSRAGWRETPRGIQDIDDVVSVVAGQTMTKGYQYDPATPIVATFRWNQYTGPGAERGWKNAPMQSVRWTHAANLPGGQVQTVSPANHVVTSPVFPTSGTPYGVHADNCTAAAPNPVRPGDSALAGQNVTIDLPTVRIRSEYGGSYVNGLNVWVQSGCDTWYQLSDSHNGGGTPSGDGYAWGAVPWGHIKRICADYPGVGYGAWNPPAPPNASAWYTRTYGSDIAYLYDIDNATTTGSGVCPQ